MAMPFDDWLMKHILALAARGCSRRRIPNAELVSFRGTGLGTLLIKYFAVVGESPETAGCLSAALGGAANNRRRRRLLLNVVSQISGIGTLMTGINFRTTIMKMRAPGMGFTCDCRLFWLDGVASKTLLISRGLPVWTENLAMLLLDRVISASHPFFTGDGGKGPMMLHVKPVFGVGGATPRFLHPDPPAFRDLRKGGRYLSGQASRLSLDVAPPWRSACSPSCWLHHFFSPMGAQRRRHGFSGVMT